MTTDNNQAKLCTCAGDRYEWVNCPACSSPRTNHVSALQAENERLKAECAELRKDAERYRWIRSVPGLKEAKSIINDSPEGIDSRIDAARAKEST